MKIQSDEIGLMDAEQNAVFMCVRKVDVLKVPGLEFHHLYIVILVRDPVLLDKNVNGRTGLFYRSSSRDLPDNEVIYYADSIAANMDETWESTVSASSECGYDVNAKKMGKLIKVPNFDRSPVGTTGQLVFSKKLASNNSELIRKILEFESHYDNSLDYSLIPEVSAGYNSNSFFRGILEFVGIADQLTVPSCFKAPGLSKTVRVANSG